MTLFKTIALKYIKYINPIMGFGGLNGSVGRVTESRIGAGGTRVRAPSGTC